MRDHQQTYIIDYGVYFTTGYYESHRTKVKNCMSEFHAKIKLEDHLKKKHSDFQSLVVYKCVHDFLGMFDFMKNGYGF